MQNKATGRYVKGESGETRWYTDGRYIRNVHDYKCLAVGHFVWGVVNWDKKNEERQKWSWEGSKQSDGTWVGKVKCDFHGRYLAVSSTDGHLVAWHMMNSDDQQWIIRYM